MSQEGNALAPPAPTLPEGHGQVAESLGAAHGQAAAQFAKLREAKAMVTHIRSALDGLASMGDSVGAEDVIKAAGGLVANGGDPVALAGLLADMPQGGQAIQAWVAGHAEQLKANEAQLDQQLGMARHEAGASALHSLAMQHIGAAFPPGAK